MKCGCVAVALAALGSISASGQSFLSIPAPTDVADLAKMLANPIANLVSVPTQANYDEGFGPRGDGTMWRVNVQPVIPFSLNEDWNLISRTILPYVEQEAIPFRGRNASGLGDTIQSFFFSPKEPVGGWIMGGGPVFLLPTASDPMLGGERWGAGPAFVTLNQTGWWTVGLLANQIWSFAGDETRADVNTTLLQPFVNYIVEETKTIFTVSAETAYDWETEQWSIPINFMASQLLRIGDQPIQVGAGVRYWAEAPAFGPEGWGFRFQVTLLFPKELP